MQIPVCNQNMYSWMAVFERFGDVYKIHEGVSERWKENGNETQVQGRRDVCV